MPYYYDFEVKLIGIQPRVIRRFMLSIDCHFRDLHQAIQDAYGWRQQHPHIFYDAKMRPLALGPDVTVHDNDKAAAMDDCLPLSFYFGDSNHGKQCIYVYGSAQKWRHHVKSYSLMVSHHQFVRQLVRGHHACPSEEGQTPIPFDFEKTRRIFDGTRYPL